MLLLLMTLFALVDRITCIVFTHSSGPWPPSSWVAKPVDGEITDDLKTAFHNMKSCYIYYNVKGGMYQNIEMFSL